MNEILNGKLMDKLLKTWTEQLSQAKMNWRFFMYTELSFDTLNNNISWPFNSLPIEKENILYETNYDNNFFPMNLRINFWL